MTPTDQETELGVQEILSSRRRNNASGQGGEDIDNIRAAFKCMPPKTSIQYLTAGEVVTQQEVDHG